MNTSLVTAFQSSTSLSVTAKSNVNATSTSLTRRPVAPTCTAVFPSKSAVRRTASTPAPAPAPDTKTTKQLPIQKEQEPVQMLKIYEQYLQDCVGKEKDMVIETPVFETNDGGLVCEWNGEIAQQKSNQMLSDYEQFLTSPQAKSIDSSKPVYINESGHLVCHLSTL